MLEVLSSGKNVLMKYPNRAVVSAPGAQAAVGRGS